MEYIPDSYEPKEVFRFFEEISAIPRSSGNESGIADYLVEFAISHGLEYIRDDMHNVLIRSKASEGCENKAPLMLQGHTDMVCEKNSTTEHDFMKDGLKLAVKDGWLFADGTTLGADDGVAVAMMLWILSDESISHPELECLFTVQEETGLAGAENFDYSAVRSKRIINIDTEDEGIAVASSAGSMNVCFTLEGDRVPFSGTALRVSVLGLAGGHSGTEINKGVMNSDILMGRLLSALYEKNEFNLVSLSGGNKRNAIPRECEAIIAVRDKDEATKIIVDTATEVYKELHNDDKGFKVHINKIGKKEKMFTFRDTSRLLSLLALVPNGVISMSMSAEGLVESSSNTGVITCDENIIKVYSYARSSVEAKMDEIFIKFRRLAKALGLSFELLDRGPGWAFEKDTKLQKLYKDCYDSLFPDMPEARVEAIHAGLECGYILKKLGGGDAIAIGPQMHDIHSPRERLDLASTERTAKLLRKMIETID